MTRAEKRFPLSPEAVKEIGRAADAVWSQIAFDCLEANGGRTYGAAP